MKLVLSFLYTLLFLYQLVAYILVVGWPPAFIEEWEMRPLTLRSFLETSVIKKDLLGLDDLIPKRHWWERAKAAVRPAAKEEVLDDVALEMDANSCVDMLGLDLKPKGIGYFSKSQVDSIKLSDLKFFKDSRRLKLAREGAFQYRAVALKKVSFLENLMAADAPGSNDNSNIQFNILPQAELWAHFEMHGHNVIQAIKHIDLKNPPLKANLKIDF